MKTLPAWAKETKIVQMKAQVIRAGALDSQTTRGKIQAKKNIFVESQATFYVREG